MLKMMVVFPGDMTLDKVSDHVKKLNKEGCRIQFSELLPSSIASVPEKKGNVIPFTAKERLTKGEEKVLDQVVARSHKSGETPLMDFMESNAVGSLKPNMTQEILAYYKKNEGHTVKQATAFLAEKFVANYGSLYEAQNKIKRLIDVMSHGKGNQKMLEKRGGKRGPGNGGKVFVIDNLVPTITYRKQSA